MEIPVSYRLWAEDSSVAYARPWALLVSAMTCGQAAPGDPALAGGLD